MDEKIEVTVRYSIEDYVRGLMFVQSQQFIVKYGVYIAPLLVLLFALFLFILKIKDAIVVRLSDFLPFFIVAILIFLLLLLLKKFPNPFLKWNIKRQFKSSPILREQQHIVFNDEGINGKTNLTSAITKWAAIIKFIETKDDFFLFTSNKYAMFVPKNAFNDDEQQNQLRELVKLKLGDKTNF